MIAAQGQHTTFRRAGKAVVNLMEEVVTLTMNIIEKIKEKIKKDVDHDILNWSHEAGLKTMTDVENMVNEFFKEIIASKRNITAHDMEGLGTELRKAFIHKWKKNFHELANEDEEKRNM